MSDQASTGNQAEPRVIRVFISSTFRDMQAERDELTSIPDMFPIVRRKDGARYGECWTKWMVLEQ